MSSDYTFFIYADNIDEKTTTELDNLLVQKTEDYEPGLLESYFSENSKCVLANVSTNMSETSRKIVDIAKKFFDNAGLVVNPTSGYITYLTYDYNSPKYIDYDGFVENVGCVNQNFRNCHECIIVTRKDENLKGGDMEVYKKDPNTFLNLIGYEKEEKDIYKLNTGTVMVFSGDTIRSLKAFSGTGNFNIINVLLFEYDSDDE